MIEASMPCTAVVTVTYATSYDLYQFTATEIGTAILEAVATLEDGTILSDNIEVEIGDGSAESGCLEPIVEFEEYYTESYILKDEDGVPTGLDTRVLLNFRVANAERSQISLAVTFGSLKYLEQKEEIYENEIISGTDCNFSAGHAVYQIISQTVLGGNVGPLRVENGLLKMDGIPNAPVVGGIPYGTGTIKVSYLSRFLYFEIKDSVSGPGYLVITDLTDSDCDFNKYSYDLGDFTVTTSVGPGEDGVDITVVYKDYVKGTVLADVSVSVDGAYRGVTDASGSIVIRNLAREVTHTISATKAGYLDTETDSLANDTFTIPAE